MSLIYSSPVSTFSVYAGHAGCAQFAAADGATECVSLKTLGITEEHVGYRTALSFFEV
jgi:hypothetical protein